MSRFNTVTRSHKGPKSLERKLSQVSEPTTVNCAGGTAYKLSDQIDLFGRVATALLKKGVDKFYQTQSDELTELKRLAEINPLFTAKLSVYARHQFGLRSVSHFLACVVTNAVKGESWVRKFVEANVRRVDDITETIACWLSLFKTPMPNSLKRGLGNAFAKFDEYSLAKYRGEGNTVSLIDAVNLTHPVPNERNKSALKKLVYGGLTSFDTWEVELSKAGSDPVLKARVWEKLIRENKLGYLAALRNIRNISEQAPTCLEALFSILTDREKVKKSLVLPFQIVTAYDLFMSTSGTDGRIFNTLNKAVDLSCVENVPVFNDRTLVVVDSSGSMGSTSNSSSPASKASLFAACILKKNPSAKLMLFSNNARYKNIDPSNSVMGIAKIIGDEIEGGGTNFADIFNVASEAYEQVIVLSDMQGWMCNGAAGLKESYSAYCLRSGLRPKLFAFFIDAYGTSMFPEENVYYLLGFSDKVFTLLGELNKGNQTACVDAVNKINFEQYLAHD